MKEGEGVIADNTTNFIGFSKTYVSKLCRKCGIMKSKSEFYDDNICMKCKEKENGKENNKT